MTVIILTACPAGLRGYLTRWLLEISSGVFVGKVSSRVRDDLWSATLDLAKDGRSIMVYSANNEQGLDFRVHRHSWTPTDFDGLTLMSRPLPRPVTHTSSGHIERNSHPPSSLDPSPTGSLLSEENSLRPGWSKASRRRFLKKHHED